MFGLVVVFVLCLISVSVCVGFSIWAFSLLDALILCLLIWQLACSCIVCLRVLLG